MNDRIRCFQFYRLHIPAGVFPEGEEITDDVRQIWRETYINNLRYASQRCSVSLTRQSGSCYLNKGECNLNQSKDDSFVELVAKNNS